MPFHFHFDHDGFDKNFRSAFSGRGSRWAAFAQRFAEEFGGNGPRPRRRRFGAEALRILVLHLLKQEPRHGYDLIKAIENMSGGLYSPSPGMIYPMLNMLADEGLIEELAGEESRRRYAITDAGRAALDAAEEQLKDALQRLADMARCNTNDDREPLREAMHDLRTAARERMADAESAAESRAERAQAIAAILREAAEKIAKL
jgi:DNA-binding PadR family transcriptional regulator